MKFLLDANLSPKTAEYLRRSFSFDAISLFEINQHNILDSDVVKLAKLESRIIITLDLDFGKLYHEINQKSEFGVIIIRTSNQTRPHIEKLLDSFLKSELVKKTFTINPNSLVVIEDKIIRFLL
jgi:predicted nuclease of predicted toxin-antitoxin system